MSGEKLKLRARDSEDIQVISAVLQDSVVPLCDMVFQKESNRFVAVAQRLRREAGEEGSSERICCALTINGVKSIQTHGIDRNDAARMLDLLAILLQPSGQQLTFVFAGDTAIRLDLESWSALVEDFGETWPAVCHPCHENGTGSRI